MSKRVIVWFRNDLRLHDNEALTDALQVASEVVPVYVFDERIFKGKTRFGFDKCGKYRTKFIVESVNALKQKLQAIGSDLCVRVGKPEEEIYELAKELKTDWVFCNRERTQEEVFVQDELEHRLWSIGQEIRYARGKMLYYTSDLPFPVTHTPDVFTQFRKEVEKIVSIRVPLDTPTNLANMLVDNIDFGTIPSLEIFGYESFTNDAGGYEWIGGEDEGLRQLKYYVWETDFIATYKKTRDELLGRSFSSKFSPWLSTGCLSPKMIYAEIQKYEKERTKNKSTYWLIFELIWRDFFRLIGKKYRNEIFHLKGVKGDELPPTSTDKILFEKWTSGTTGIPFIDANMRELLATGFMSNRGRQNVASFLVKDLKLDWRMGAEHFESYLMDYDPCSNYGNWNYIAGIGNDPREDRYFNIISQAKKYDAKGEYVKYWVPELKNVPAEQIHTLEELSDEELSSYGVNIGVDYPEAILKSSHWK